MLPRCGAGWIGFPRARVHARRERERSVGQDRRERVHLRQIGSSLKEHPCSNEPRIGPADDATIVPSSDVPAAASGLDSCGR